MIVTLKTLQEDTFTVDIDASESVRYLKEKIETLRGHDYPAKSMKLMYAGKFLVDQKQICDYDVEEKKFVICVAKLPNQPVLDGQDGSGILINGSNQSDRERIQQMEYDQMVSNIVELGFSRSDVVHALTASYHNPDRAVEYLINTIGETSREHGARDMELDLMNDEVLMRQVLEGGPPSPNMSDIPSQERIFELFSETVAECRNRSREQDELAEREHERITRTYAEMEAGGLQGPLSAIREELNNAFGPMSASSTNILSSVGDVFSGPTVSTAADSTNSHESTRPTSINSPRSTAVNSNNPRPNGVGSTSHLGARSRDVPPPLLTASGEIYDIFNEVFSSDDGSISSTEYLLERDQEAISRLMQVGFSHQKAVQAYYVCDKNENAAAELLLSKKFD